MIKLSIILPIYNVKEYLSICLDSLLQQDISIEQYEIICVNDGSSDGSAAVVQDYQDHYKNIILINQANGGVCNARNSGLRQAKGAYIWFIDPDDYISPYSLGFIMQSLEESQAVICNISFQSVPETAKPDEVIVPHFTYNKKSKAYGSCCAHIVRRECTPFLNEKLHYGEDYLWEFEVCTVNENQISIVPEIYFYRQRSSSAMHSKTEEKKQQYIDDMHRLALEYRKLAFEGKYAKVRANIEDRIGLCIQSMIVSEVQNRCSWEHMQSMLNTLKKEELYPYKFLWFLLKPQGSMKQSIFNIVCFFMKSELVIKMAIFLQSIRKIK